MTQDLPKARQPSVIKRFSKNVSPWNSNKNSVMTNED